MLGFVTMCVLILLRQSSGSRKRNSLKRMLSSLGQEFLDTVLGFMITWLVIYCF